MSGRNFESVDVIAKDIISAGEAAETARVDALDEQAVERHAASVAGNGGCIDVSPNAIGLMAFKASRESTYTFTISGAWRFKRARKSVAFLSSDKMD